MDCTSILCAPEEDGLLFITLNRPEWMNSFTPTMSDELVDAYRRASADPAIRVIILAGAGKNFCAGMDLSADGNVFGLDDSLTPTMEDLLNRPEDPALVKGVWDTGGRVVMAMVDCGKPIIAAIHGAAVGVGATMPLAADIRMAADDARIGFAFGRDPESCSSWFLPRLVGPQQAFEWFYSAEPFPASEGLAAVCPRICRPGFPGTREACRPCPASMC